MKRIFILLTVLFCCLFLSSCSAQDDSPAYMVDPIRFYYCRTVSDEPAAYEYDTGSIGYEYRDLGEERLSPEQVLSIYLNGPENEDLRSPFPPELDAISVHLERGVLTVRFNGAIARLSGMDLTASAACLVHTMTQLDEIEFVKMEAEQPLLSGLLSVPLEAEDFVLTDDYMTGDHITVRLFFPVDGEKYLREETCSGTALSDDEIPAFVLRQLMTGSRNDSSGAAFPEGTELLDVKVTDGECVVDLSSEFLTNAPDSNLEARLQLLAVVNSLTDLEGIDTVRFLCQGSTVTSYGPLSLSEQMQGEPDAVETARPTLVQATSLYLPTAADGKLAEIPVYVRKSAGRQLEADVLNELFSYESKNGYVNVIPEGTSVVELKVASQNCQLTLSSSFADLDNEPEKMLQAVRSVVASLCALDTVETVRLKIADRELESVDLSRVLTPTADWLIP